MKPGNQKTEYQLVEEIASIRNMGFNFLRLAHYPQRETVLELCDEFGIVVWEELPWSRGGVGDDASKAETEKQLWEMIIWHYNHPSIIFWGLGNEVRIEFLIPFCSFILS